jgi:hypothetical protein
LPQTADPHTTVVLLYELPLASVFKGLRRPAALC